MSSTTVASPNATTSAHENVLRQIMVADLTLQTSSPTENPLRVPVVLAAVVLVLHQVIDYPVKCDLTDSVIGIGRDLLSYRSICHFFKPVLVPKWALACFPDQATHIAKLAATATNY